VTRRRNRANGHRRPVARRSGSFPGRRVSVLLALALGAFGGSAALASADPSSNVLVTATLYSSGGTSTDSVTVAGLQSNPAQCPTYQGQSMNELGRQGFVDVPLPPNETWSLPTILDCLETPIPLSSVTGITVMSASGSPETGSGSQLTSQDLATPSDFNNSSESPVVEANGSFNQYDRPWRGNSQGQPDYDFLDEVQGTQDDAPAPISIEVFEGPRLTVTATASQTSVRVGGTVSFSATVTGTDDGGLSYSWNFDGGAPNSTAASPQATFAGAGQYEVALQVTDAAGGGGDAEIAITVGSAAPAATGKHKQSGVGNSRKSHSPTGPRKSSGSHAGGAAGNHKSQSSSAGKTPTPSTSHTSTTPGSTSTTPASTSTTPSHPAAPTSRSPARRASARAPRLKRPVPRTQVEGPLVSGQLISDVTPVPAGVSPLVHSVPPPAASAPPARQAVRTSPVPALAGVFGVVVLLALGAIRELRGRRGWQALRAGS
jgi:PKD domain